MKRLAIIPARGGSKRIPRKNIKNFLGKPIIAYSIETALASNLFDKVIVSTEDTEIAEISKEYGAQVPFFRSINYANDYATLSEVIEEVVQRIEKQEGILYEALCCMLPTAPLTSVKQIKDSLSLLESDDVHSVTPVIPFSYPIWRSLKINDKNRLEMIWPQYLNNRSQDLQVAYHDAGTFYWIRRDRFMNQKTFFTSNNKPFVLNEMEVHDIDNIDDWRLAELKYKLLNEET
jgi:N-acylneuraminate cytidylyltransferase